MIRRIWQYGSLFSPFQLKCCSLAAASKTALKIVAAVAVFFILYCASRYFYRRFTFKPVDAPPKPLPPTESTVCEIPLDEEGPDNEAFHTPPSEMEGQDDTENVQNQPSSDQLTEQLKQLLPPFEKLKKRMQQFSLPCELPRKNGTMTINFINYFIQLNQVKDFTLEENGKFRFTSTSKLEFTLSHLPEFALKKVHKTLHGFLKNIVNQFKPKVQISDVISGQINYHEFYLEIILDKGAITIPAVARYPFNYTAELNSIKFSPSHDKNTPPFFLFINAEHDSTFLKKFNVTGENLRADPDVLIKFLDLNLLPHEYGL